MYPPVKSGKMWEMKGWDLFGIPGYRIYPTKNVLKRYYIILVVLGILGRGTCPGISSINRYIAPLVAPSPDHHHRNDEALSVNTQLETHLNRRMRNGGKSEGHAGYILANATKNLSVKLTWLVRTMDHECRCGCFQK